MSLDRLAKRTCNTDQRAAGGVATRVHIAAAAFLVSCYWAVPLVRPPLGVMSHFGFPEIASLFLFVAVLGGPLSRPRNAYSEVPLLVLTMIWVSCLFSAFYLDSSWAAATVAFSSAKLTMWMITLRGSTGWIGRLPSCAGSQRSFSSASSCRSSSLCSNGWEFLALEFYAEYPARSLPRIHSSVGCTSVNMGTMCAINSLVGVWLIAKAQKPSQAIGYVTLEVCYLGALVLVHHRIGLMVLAFVGPSLLLMLRAGIPASLDGRFSPRPCYAPPR